MSKHYVDPLDKPTLQELHYNTDDKYATYANLYEICKACLRVPEMPVVNQGPGETDAIRRLYVVQIPYNKILNKDEHYRFYFSWLGAKNFIARHNKPTINKENGGSRRKAQLLMYTPEEIQVYVDSIDAINTVFTLNVGL